MPLPAAELLADAVKLYAAAGAIFAVLFAWRGAGTLDPAARAGTLGFRLLIVPGSAALWPLLLVLWARASKAARESKAAHGDGERTARQS